LGDFVGSGDDAGDDDGVGVLDAVEVACVALAVGDAELSVAATEET
jgi:hypothetical protein